MTHQTQQVAAGRRAGASGPENIDSLTGLRIVAALWVVAEHFRELLFGVLPLPRFLWPVVRSGYLGVEVFFILSGLVIAHNYADRFRDGFGRGYRPYLRARVARIYPVHVVTLVVLAGMVLVAQAMTIQINSGVDFSAENFALNAAMLQGLPGVPALNWPAWSISVEMAAYVVFPLIAFMLHRLGRRGALGLLPVVLVSGVLAIQVVGQDGNALAPAVIWLRIGIGFLVGCLLWKIRSTRPLLSARVADAGIVASVVAVGIIVCSASTDESRLSFVAIIPIAALVFFCAARPGFFAAALASSPMMWGGRVSYSLYLTHGIVFLAVGKLLPWEKHVDDGLAERALIVLLVAFILTAVAVSTYYVIEEPGRRVLRGSRFAQSRKGLLQEP